MITYAIKSALVLTLLYLGFLALTRRDALHRLNRSLLLATLVLSLIVPFVQLSVTHPMGITEEIARVSMTYRADVPADLAIADGNRPERALLSAATIVTCAYLLGVVAILFFTLAQLFIILHNLRGGLRHTDGYGNTVILRNGDVAPCSIFRFIVMGIGDYSRNRDAILRHEQAHIRFRHTYDLLLLQVVRAVQWFNPFVWMLGRDLKAIHEYEADEAVILQGIDAKTYQQILVTKAVGKRLQPLANHLCHSTLKKRFVMMYQKKPNRTKMLKALFVLPATALALYAFATPKVQETLEKVEVSTTETTDILSKIAPGTPENTAAAATDTAAPGDSMENEFGDTPKAVNRSEEALMIVDGNVVEDRDFKLSPLDVAHVTVMEGKALRGLQVPNVENVAEKYKSVIFITTQKAAQAATDHTKDIYQNPEVRPEYPGGDTELMADLAANLKFPTTPAAQRIDGMVHVRFVIETDGTVSHTEVAQSLDPDCDAAAVKAVGKLKKFKPARDKGETVRCSVTLPIRFKAQ